MSDSPVPTLQVMLVHLSEVGSDWFVFGIALGVPISKLRSIEASHLKEGVKRCIVEMLQYWLDTTQAARWQRVIAALEQVDLINLASRVKQKYLWDQSAKPKAKDSEGAVLSATDINGAPPNATTPSSSTSPSTPPPESTDSGADQLTPGPDAKAEIEADGRIVRQLRNLVSDYSIMLTDFREQFKGCDISRAQFFLNKIFKTNAFTSCDNIDKILDQLSHRDIDTFNVYYLQQLATCLKRDNLKKLVNEYEKKKEKFLEDTTVLDFQKAVVSKTKPNLPKGMVEVRIKIPKHLATEKILRDMELLAMEAFEDNQKSLVRFHAYSGSIIICWFVVESLCEVLQRLAREKVAVWRQHGVEEVMVGSQCVYHYTDQEPMEEEPAIQYPQGIKRKRFSDSDDDTESVTKVSKTEMSPKGSEKISEQECAALKKVYGEFYHQLVDALSDGDTHHSIVSDLHKRSVISEKVQAEQMTSTQERGRSLLTVLGLEEKPHNLRELITVMMEVEKVKSLAEEMTAQLSKSEQGDHTAEQQQFEAGVDQLTSDKEDLLAQLKSYEEELKAANELLIMREKVISSWMAEDKGPKISVKKIVEQHEAAMADLNTKLKNTNEKLSSANKLLAAQESELKEMRRRVGDLEELLSVHFPSSLVQVTGEGKEVAVLEQETTIQLSISSQDTLSVPFPIEQLSCQLTNPKSQRLPCYITRTQPGVCTLTFTPVLLGPHQLKITIRDTDIPGSPFTIHVVSSAIIVPENRGIVQRTIHGVISPYSVAVSKSGEVVVSECWNDRISVYSREGKHIRSFGSKGQFKDLRGVAITSDNHILIADEGKHRIQMFTMEGRFVKSVGQKGKRQLEFNLPSGIAVHPSGRVFVADTYNHCIQVLNPDLSYSHMFGSKGSAPGQFSYPFGLSINSSGVVYVTDSENHRVQLFSANGQFISSFGSEGSQHGQLYRPRGICVDSSNTVYVTDGSDCVSVYTSSGQFIKSFGTKGSGEGELDYPKGIAVDNTTGALYVCDFSNNRVVVY